MRKEQQWDYEDSVPVQDTYREDEMCAEEAVTELEGYGGNYGGYDGYTEELGNYGSDLNGYMEEGYSKEKKDRIEGIQDSAFLLNETDRFIKGTNAAQIRENFRGYVRDVNSGDDAAKRAAQEGACRDLEFFIISIVSRKFSTYVEKDREFFEDLVQAGRIGVITALPKYNPDKGMPTTYFFKQILHEMTSQVNTMKHDTKSYVATTKKKIQEVDRQFAKYGRTPTLHDYVYIINSPFHRITNALAELKAGNTKTSIDDPEAVLLSDRQSAMRGPEESAISNVNFNRLLEIAHELEPRDEIIQCFIEMCDGKVKTAELAEQYGLPASEIMEGVNNLKNLLRYHPEMRRMYPERFRAKEHELSEQIAYMPVEEGHMAMENVLDSLKAMPDGGQDLDVVLG